MSNLYDQIEEDELKLKEEDKEPEGAVAEETLIEEAEEAEEVSDEEEEEEEPEEEPEQKLDASAYVRMRKEKRALQDENEALKAEKTPQVTNDTDPEPNKAEAYEEWLEWKDRGLSKRQDKIEEWQGKQDRATEQKAVWNGAVNEFQGFEKQFQKITPDYEAAATHMKDRLSDSYRLVNPELTAQEVDSKVSNYILQNAAQAAQSGYNPAESLYRQSKERFGFTKQEAASPTRKRTDLKKIDSNRRKSASPLQSGGQSSSAQIGIEEVAGMSMADFAKLTPSQLRELESQ